MNKGFGSEWSRRIPARTSTCPRSPREEMLFLTTDEVRALAEKIDPHYRVLIYVAAYTGRRSGELLARRRQDVDLLRGVLHERRALKRIPNFGARAALPLLSRA